MDVPAAIAGPFGGQKLGAAAGQRQREHPQPRSLHPPAGDLSGDSAGGKLDFNLFADLGRRQHIGVGQDGHDSAPASAALS